ncbi:glycoside hydrolase family 97 catalytic domain-containing protein [Streptomyces sp. ZAF1911]|uniref:glycoside hydrolase family 97 protein n=1 Tax=Streptomyces sp. ZAF1911 TaxID=2944129 RepID=UPI00237AB0C0|nr:glycoside hydrolase family 97 protein [Streptomyces sp. ZAF1911]MDD9375963.1 glycoside hydrolase family 97 catalytic domain-containing protein [Streptomyces sp. ZAF1911]
MILTERWANGAAATISLAVAFGMPAVPPAAAATVGWTSVQPGVPATGCDGVRATVTLDDSGTPSLGATSDCREALSPAPIGLVTSAVDYSKGLSFVSRSDQTVNYTYKVAAGSSLQRTRTATETKLVFTKGTDKITVFVRTSPEGVAVRYELPTGATVLREATSFDLPADTQVTYTPFQAAHENQYANSTVSALATGEYGLDMFARNSNGSRVLLSESGVNGDYSGGRLTHTLGTNRFTVKLADAQVVFTNAFALPWRVATIGSTGTIVESTLGDDVAPASKVADTSWIKPGIAGWLWFDGGKAAQANQTKLQAWVDYAASQGWPYVMVDDGWKGVTWMPDLVAYASARGVKIMLWYNSADLATDAQREAEFSKISGWGIAGVKLDFMDSESQARYKWYDATAASTAKYKLVVDFHGSRLPDGVHRTWPHVLTSEAVRGEEYGSARTINHVSAIPFTRGALGPVDTSPMSFQRGNPNSDAAELALGVLYQSGIMLPGSTIPGYQARPEAQRWMRQLPVVWDETKFVSGDPLSGAVIARRSGDRWFVGALRNGTATTISYPTTFLGSGNWHAEITTDGPNGLVRTSKVIQAGDTLSVDSVANGGHAVRLTKVATVPAGYRKVAVGNEVMDVSASSTANDAKVVRYTSHDAANQRFEFRALGDGYTRIVNQNSGKDVAIQTASRNATAKAIQYTYASGATTNDEWLLEDAGNGQIRILNRYSGLYLTAGASTGTQFDQRPYNGTANQKFTVS